MTNITRCSWSEKSELYKKYHDEEWGVPVNDEIKMFENLILEGFQAGLSWLTILQKREGFRKAFDQFDYSIIAEYDESKIVSLLNNQDIVRHRLKVLATINNAKCILEMHGKNETLVDFFWKYVDYKPIKNHWDSLSSVPTKTPLSDKISKDLKKIGFKFVGSTTVYAHLQAVGVVNDHISSCFKYEY